MKYRTPPFASAVFLASSALWTSAAAANLYRLDPDHTQIVFTIDHLGYSRVTGTFHDLKGTLIFDEKQPETSHVEVTIATAGIDTGSAARDEDLRASDYFDVVKFPILTFKSTKVKKKNARTADVTGELTMLGMTRPVVLYVTFNKLAPDLLRANKMVAGFTASATLKRSDFGMTAFLPLIGDEVRIAINAEAIRE